MIEQRIAELEAELAAARAELAARQPPAEAIVVLIGEAIRRRRKELRFTLLNLSDEAGISLGYLSQIELGKNSPSLCSLLRLAEALRTPLHALLRDAVEYPDGTPRPRHAARPAVAVQLAQMG